MAQQFLDRLAEHDVTGSIVRLVDHDVAPGVEADMGDGDAWPPIRDQIVRWSDWTRTRSQPTSTRGWTTWGSPSRRRGGTYWNGKAMHSTDYIELDETPEPTASAMSAAAANAVHLARLLKQSPYPPQTS